MVNTVAKARINLFALLRCLEELPEIDAEARSIAEGKPETVEFVVGGLGRARLVVGRGRIELAPGRGPCGIRLWLPSPEALCAMFEGGGKPIPLKGFLRLGFLSGPFTRLTEILTRYLKHDPGLLADPAYRAANARLSLKAAVFALAEIGNGDAEGALHARRMPEGEIEVSAPGSGPYTLAATGGRLEARKGRPERARARMLFPSLEAAGALLRGEVDAHEAIATGKLELWGYMPLLDNLSKILGLVPRYLN
jgi:hypothetical protein